jgi:hypothetical protein
LSHRQIVGGRRRKPQCAIDEPTNVVHVAAKIRKALFDPQTKPMNIAGGSVDLARFGTWLGTARW